MEAKEQFFFRKCFLKVACNGIANVRVTRGFITVLWEGGMLRIASSTFVPNFKYKLFEMWIGRESPLPAIFWAIDCFIAPLSSLGSKSLPLNVWRISWRRSKYNMLAIACSTLITPEQFTSFSLVSWSAEWNKIFISTLTSSKASWASNSCLKKICKMPIHWVARPGVYPSKDAWKGFDCRQNKPSGCLVCCENFRRFSGEVWKCQMLMNNYYDLLVLYKIPSGINILLDLERCEIPEAL